MPFGQLHQRYLDRMRDVGIPEPTAREIVATLNEVAGQRSALRLRAAQGGWLDSDEYVDALHAIADGQQLIRSRYGDDVFERYLYATLEPNRVMVSSARAAGPDGTGGLEPGDIIHRLDEVRCFSIREFRQRVDQRDPNERVSLTVRRGSQFVVLKLAVTLLQQLAVEPAYAKPRR